MAAQGRILCLILVLLVLPIALTATAHAVPRGVLIKPNWTVGDFWDYTVSLSIPDPTGGPPHNETGTAMMTVNATEKLVLGGAIYDTFKLTTRTSVLIDGEVRVSFTQTGWYLRSDLSLVMSKVNLTIFGFVVTSGEAYVPPQLMQWPVVSGGSWTSSSNITIDLPAFQAHFVQPESANFTANQPQKVKVAAGTFRTLPVQKTVAIRATGSAGAFSLYSNEMGLLVWRYLSSANSMIRIQSFWANQVGAPVRQVATGDLGFIGTSELTSFHYEPNEH